MAQTAVQGREYKGVSIPPKGTYELDAVHTVVGFVARHMLSKVRGQFTEFTGTIEVGDSPEDSRVEVEVKTESITTHTQKRDQHLMSGDFLEIEKHPVLTFKSTAVRPTGGTSFELDGALTIKDITRPVTLWGEFLGWGPDMEGEPMFAASAKTTIDREDWDMTWNVAVETGGFLVGKKVDLEIEVEAHRVSRALASSRGKQMTTAIIGVGNIGKAVARHLVDGGERVVLAARDESNATALAKELGELASATSVEKAITDADVVVFAVWFDTLKDLIAQHANLLRGKVVVDPSNPVAQDTNGRIVRTLPDGQSSGSVVAGLLPAEAHFVKAFGTLGAESLASEANRTPRAVLFYATDDDEAGAAIERLIAAAGFDPVKAGGVDAALRIETSGALHQFGGLNGKVVDASEARTAVPAAA